MKKNNRIKIPLRQKTILIVSGLLLTLAVLEAGMRLAGFIILSLQERRNRLALRQKGTYIIMCLGESSTQRQYPPYLEEILNQSNTGIKFSVIDKGIGGTNTESIVSQLEANLDKYQPDLVLTMMGANDYGHHIPYEGGPNTQTVLFLKSLRTYKLARLLWLHITTKAKEIGFYKPQQDNRLAQRLRHSLQETGLKAVYSEQDDSIQQATSFNERAIELNPQNDQAYAELGRLYIIQGKAPEAEEAFNKAIELNPQNDQTYEALGRLYRRQVKLPEAEERLNKAIELNPQNDQAYAELGRLYIRRRRLPEAEEAFNKAIELNPQNDQTYAALSWLYIRQGKLPEAEVVLKRAIELNPQSYRPYGNLALLYNEKGNYTLYKEYREKARQLRERFYYPVTVENYRRFKQILDRRKLKWICVQYPNCTIEPLKKIFAEGEEGIFFVDNEKIFKSAVLREGYREYFKDNFGGEFGHCTEKGNRLLAKNIASAILKEVFGK